MGLSQRRSRLVTRLRGRKTREREALVLVEGVRGVREALASGARVRFAVVSPRLESVAGGAELGSALIEHDIEIEQESDETLTELADTEHPQGVLMVCAEERPSEAFVAARGRYLVLDGIQDPGNVGTLVRASTAFALDGVLVLDGSADPWSAKAVRAAAGMTFRLPVLTLRAPEAVELLRSGGVPILVADAKGRPVGGLGGTWALVVGNEGSGPRPLLVEAAAAAVRIPMPGPAESLNAGVAGAILLYALTQEETVAH